MDYFYLSPHDLCWMRRRLGHTVRLTSLMLAISFLANISSNERNDRHVSRMVMNEGVELVALADSAFDSNAHHGFNSVPPVGWRRTTRGWEHVSQWAQLDDWSLPNDSINSLLQQQAAKEPAMARSVLARVSRLSPVTFALIQITAILTIAWITTLHRKPSHSTTSP